MKILRSRVRTGLGMGSLLAGAAGAAGLAISGAAAAGPAGEGLAPHRAVYEIGLARAAPSSGIAELTGRMVYELVGSSCQGYTQNMRLVTQVASREGSLQVNDLRTSSFEAGDGSRLRFNLSQYKNDELVEATQGDARRRDDGTIKVELTKPGQKSLRLPVDVRFPMQHSLAMLEAARQGQRQLTMQLYDGSEQGSKIYFTSAFIGDKLADGKAAAELVPQVSEGAGLTGLAAWPVAISYYGLETKGTDAVPAYELSFRFFENGVSSQLLIDYGDFAISGELKQLTMLEKESCEGGAPAR